MSFKSLPTLADLRRAPQAIPKTGKAQRILETDAEKKADDKQLLELRKIVWARDEGKCRACKKRVMKSLEVSAKRWEVAHIRSRRFAATRYEPKNCFLACHVCHALVDQHLLVIVGTATFDVDGQKLIDADQKLEFIRQ